MRCVFRSMDRLQVGYLGSVLESYGIRCLRKNEYLGGGIGELPVTECWPELWVIDDGQYEYARDIIDTAMSDDKGTLTDWRCSRCGEMVEGQFGVCWNCGLLKDGPWEP